MYKYDKNFFEIIDTEEKAYWLGFIAADGNIREDLHKMRIELNIRDKKHLEKFRSAIHGNMPIKEWIRHKNHSCYIEVNSVKLCKDLLQYGVTPNKSLTLEILFDKISFVKFDIIVFTSIGSTFFPTFSFSFFVNERYSS